VRKNRKILKISRLTGGRRLPSFRAPSVESDFKPSGSFLYYIEMKTFSAKPHEVERKWYVIDAKGKVLGQVAVEAARLLRGKNKPIFTTHVDTGDFVIVINADQCVLSGNKETEKIYTRFTGYVGGKKVETPHKLRERRPTMLVERAVWGMIPKTRLGRAQFGKLKVYAGASHPHEAQQPVAHEVR
jgi:large subunit ribosomal protein L13